MTPETQSLQVALRKSVHAVSMRTQEVSNNVEDGMTPQISAMTIQAIKEAVKRDLAREMATKQLEVEDTLLKRKSDTIRQSLETQPPKSAINRVQLPQGVCVRCGSKDHKRCGWNELCDYCKRRGHKDVVCFRRLRDRESRGDPT